MLKRSILLALAFVATLGSVSFAQFGGPGVNSQFNAVWNFVWEPSTSKPTYIAASQSFALASSAKVFFQINGSATKTVRIRRVILTGSVPATALAEPLFFNKVSTAMPATGTSVLLTSVPLDSNYSAATATVENFTANPTDPTLVGEVITPVVRFLPNSTEQTKTEFVFGQGGSNVILRGAAQGLSLNLGAVTTSAVVTVAVEWTEE